MEAPKSHTRRRRIEFGDFQTPAELATSVCRHLADTISPPNTVIEPACGTGSFLFAAADAFPAARSVMGIDINRQYINQVRRVVQRRADSVRFRLQCSDALRVDWANLLGDRPKPWLVVGNPPWVTNSVLGKLDSRNLPTKKNIDSHRGLDAVTGKSNFDISEYLMRQILSAFTDHDATLAMLCKNSVARKLLRFAYRQGLKISRSRMYSIDAAAEFNAAVDACLFVCEFQARRLLPERRTANQNRVALSRILDTSGHKLPKRSADASSPESLDEPTPTDVYASISSSTPSRRIGWHRGNLIANLDLFQHSRHLMSGYDQPTLRWRSGVKHDCAAVLELIERDGKLWNKIGEEVDIENDCVYPFLKSSDLANGNTKSPRRWLIVPQHTLGEDTSGLARTVPRTWQYLLAHADRLDSRRSSIYRHRPRFSIFGIGDYTFSPWKVAISGMYKQLVFHPVGQRHGKSILFDDTCYFLSCRTRRESQRLSALLNSQIAREYFSAIVCWDSKRPITVELLRSLNLDMMAMQVKCNADLDRKCATG